MASRTLRLACVSSCSAAAALRALADPTSATLAPSTAPPAASWGCRVDCAAASGGLTSVVGRRSCAQPPTALCSARVSKRRGLGFGSGMNGRCERSAPEPKAGNSSPACVPCGQRPAESLSGTLTGSARSPRSAAWPCPRRMRSSSACAAAQVASCICRARKGVEAPQRRRAAVFTTCRCKVTLSVLSVLSKAPRQKPSEEAQRGTKLEANAGGDAFEQAS
jgi:hypothetical protein